MKKFVVILLAVLCVISCISCGNSDDTGEIINNTDAPTITDAPDTETPDTKVIETDEPDTDVPDDTKAEDIAPSLEEMKVSLKAIADTYVVNDKAKTMDFGSEDRLRVKKDDSQAMTRRAFIKFDTSGVNSFENVNKVTLRVECQFISNDATEIAGRDVNLYVTSSEWKENSFNWDTQPAVIEKIADVESSIFVKYSWVEIDVTDYVKEHIGETITFSLWNEGVDSEGNYLDFNSREKATHEPILIIEGLGTYVEVEVKPIVGGGAESWMPVADTYVESKNGDPLDIGTTQEMMVKKADNAKLSRRLYVKFDTSATTVKNVNKATLRLYCTYVSKDVNEIPTRDMNLYVVSSDWREGTFTWSTQPEVIEKVADVESESFVAWEWIEIDVTDYIKKHIGEIVTFSLWNEGIDSEANHLNFFTREKEGQEPQLVIE